MRGTQHGEDRHVAKINFGGKFFLTAGSRASSDRDISTGAMEK